MKKVRLFSFVLCMALFFSLTLSAYAASNPDTISADDCSINIVVNDDIGFVMKRDEKTSSASVTKGKQYTSDSYSGYFYVISTGQRISNHTFTAYFSYDGTMASCYNTNASIVMDPDYTGNLRPKAENRGRNNLTPTLVYGYVTFVLYNPNNTVNTEVTVNVYCNQNGSTWIEHQG